MRRTAYIVSAWTLLLAACGPAAAPGPTTALAPFYVQISLALLFCSVIQATGLKVD